MKRNVMMIAVLIVLFAVIAACSSGNEAGENEANNNQPPTSTNNDQENESSGDGSQSSYYMEEPTTVSMHIVNHQSWPYSKDWPIWEWIREATNITIDGQVPAGDGPEALNLAMASGDVQDIVFLSPTDANRFGQQGALVDLNEYLDDMPNLKKHWEENPEYKAMTLDPSGANYMVANVEIGFSNQRSWMYREDIFSEHGLEAPENWDELYEVAKELKSIYPDSYPFVFRSNLTQFNVFGPAFGTFHSMYPDIETGEVRYGPVEDEYRTMIEHIHRMVDEGLTPPDWLSMNTQQWNEYIATEQSFITVDYIGRIESFNNALEGTGAHFVFMPPPAGEPGGDQYILDGNYNLSGFAVFSQSDNIDAAIKYIDFLYSDEGMELANWGVEGETYELVDGEKEFMDQFIDFPTLRRETGMITNGAYGRVDVDAALQFTPEEERYVYDEAPQYAYPMMLIEPAFKEDEQETLSTVYDSIRTSVEENVAKFVIGDRPFSEWDAYVEEINNLGLQQIIDLYQNAWDRQ